MTRCCNPKGRCWCGTWFVRAATILLLATLAVLWLMMVGCGSPRVDVAPGKTTLTQKVETRHPDGTIEIKEAAASGVGSSLRASTSDGSVASEFNGSAPEVKLEGIGTGKGGGAESDIKITGKAKTGLLVLVGFLVVMAAACLWLGIRSAAIALGCGAGLVLVAYVYPAALGLAILFGFAGVFWLGYKYLRSNEALRAVAAGIEANPMGQVVKEEIAKHADQRDKATINRIKEKDGL